MGYDSESFTAGIGFTWHGYAFDYGYFSREEAGSSHPITLSARLGKPLEQQIAEQDEARRIEEERMLNDLFAARIASHIDAADSLRGAGELESALDEVKIALEYDPGSERALTLRDEIGTAILAAQAERAKDSEKELLINQHFELGLRHYNANEYILARAEWRNVLEIDPENVEALGYLRRTEEKLDEQLQSHVSTAAEYERTGRLPEAIGEWNIVSMIEPDNAEAAAAIERIKLRINSMSRDYNEANRKLQTIDLYERALTAFSEGRYEDAVTLSQQVLQLDPAHEGAKDLINGAQRRMRPLSDEENEEIRTLYIQGMTYFGQKEYEKAIEIYSRILEINPYNESVRKQVEEARQRLKKLESPEGG